MHIHMYTYMYAQHTTRTPCHTLIHTQTKTHTGANCLISMRTTFIVKILFNLQILAVRFLGSAISMQMHLIALGSCRRPLNELYVTLSLVFYFNLSQV